MNGYLAISKLINFIKLFPIERRRPCFCSPDSLSQLRVINAFSSVEYCVTLSNSAIVTSLLSRCSCVHFRILAISRIELRVCLACRLFAKNQRFPALSIISSLWHSSPISSCCIVPSTCVVKGQSSDLRTGFRCLNGS